MGATGQGVAVIIALLGGVYFAKQQNGLVKGAIISRGYEVVTMMVLSFVVRLPHPTSRYPPTNADLCAQLFGIILGLLAGADKW